MGSHVERAGQSHGRTARIAGGEEGRIATGTGKLGYGLVCLPLLTSSSFLKPQLMLDAPKKKRRTP
jgi:hypothetical protein